jgi:hypothetical protein
LRHPSKKEKGEGSREKGEGSREKGEGSREQGEGRREQAKPFDIGFSSFPQRQVPQVGKPA